MGQQPLRLAFAPPPGQTLAERSTTVRTERFGGLPERTLTERVEASSESTYAKDGDGWLLTQRVTRIDARRDGARVGGELAQVVTRFPLRIRLAADGAFIAFTNPEDAQAAVRQTFPPGQVDAYLDLFTREALEQVARREWEGKYGGLFERNLTEGDALYAYESVSLSTGGSVGYLLERKVAGLTATDHGEALVLSLRCIGAPSTEGEQEAVRQLAPEGARLEPSVTCTGQQVVARAPFLPVKLWMKLSAAPGAQGEGPAEVTLVRETAAEGD